MLTDAIRKMMLMGIGAVSLTKERAEILVKELTDKGELGQTEARTLVGELIHRGEQERAAVQKTVQGEMARLRAELGLVGRRELSRLEGRLRRLEEHLNLSPAPPEPEAGEQSTETNPPA